MNEKGVEKRLIRTYGSTRFDTGSKPVQENTFFDLASLTKPLCTVQSVLSLIENKKTGWNSPLKSLIRHKTGPYLKKITIGQLLSHSSGIKGYKEYFLDYKAQYKKNNKEKIIKTILKEPLAYQPGRKCIYSDLGYILLGEIVEQVSGSRFDVFFEKKIAKPMHLENDIFFKPFSKEPDKRKKKYAATEKCPWRKKMLQGEVQDENCWLMGGVSGHAGLFGTISGVLTMTENILKIWKGNMEHPAYSSGLLQKALKKIDTKETWCMGFDTPSLSGSSAGRYMSRSSVGHLGYTGTSFWIDPERELVVVLLTNRVHPTRHNENIKKFRPLFHDTVIISLNKK